MTRGARRNSYHLNIVQAILIDDSIFFHYYSLLIERLRRISERALRDVPICSILMLVSRWRFIHTIVRSDIYILTLARAPKFTKRHLSYRLFVLFCRVDSLIFKRLCKLHVDGGRLTGKTHSWAAYVDCIILTDSYIYTGTNMDFLLYTQLLYT